MFGCHAQSASPMTNEDPDSSDFLSDDLGDATRMSRGLDDYGDECMDHSEPIGSIQTAAAKFLLVLKEQHRLTQVSINFLID